VVEPTLLAERISLKESQVVAADLAELAVREALVCSSYLLDV
jgi:hypothetical protein